MAIDSIITDENVKKNRPLTRKEKAFCEFYVKGEKAGNATWAALQANYSEKTATNIASQNLGKLHIKAYIAQLDAEVQEIHRRMFHNSAEMAISSLRNVAENARVEVARVMACNSLLDRAGYKPADTIKSDITSKNEHNISVSSDGAKDKLAAAIFPNGRPAEAVGSDPNTD